MELHLQRGSFSPHVATTIGYPPGEVHLSHEKKQGLYRVVDLVKDSLLLILQYELCFSLYSGGKLISCPQTVFHDPTDHLVEELEHELLLMWTSFQIYGACSHHSCVPYANRRRRLGLPRQRSTARSFKWSLLAIESLTNCMPPAADSAPAHSIREGAEPLKFRRLQRCVECGLVGTAEVDWGVCLFLMVCNSDSSSKYRTRVTSVTLIRLMIFPG